MQTPCKEHLKVNGKERLTSVAVGVGQYSLQALRGCQHAGVGSIFTADFPIHSAEDLRRQMESIEDLVFPLVNGNTVLQHENTTIITNTTRGQSVLQRGLKTRHQRRRERDAPGVEGALGWVQGSIVSSPSGKRIWCILFPLVEKKIQCVYR